MRRFGKIVVKPNKSNPKYIEASYPTPVDAFPDWRRGRPPPSRSHRKAATMRPHGSPQREKESMPESGSPRGSSEGVSGRKA